MRLRCRIGWHEYQLIAPNAKPLSQNIVDTAFNMDRFQCIHCGKEECHLSQAAQQRMAEYWKEHRWNLSMKSVDGLVDAAFDPIGEE